MQMNIKRSSWHYRWLDKMDKIPHSCKNPDMWYYEPMDTCEYFGLLIGNIISTTLIVSCASLLTMLHGFTLSWLIACISTGIFYFPNSDLAGVMLLVYSVLCIIGVIAGFVYLAVSGVNKITSIGFNDSNELFEIFSLVKEKTCKQIKLVD